MKNILILVIICLFFSSGNIAAAFRFPLDGNWNVSLDFGVNNPGWGIHLAEDVSRSGGTSVYAAANGVVKFAGFKNDYERVIVIEHNTGTEYVCTVYGHLSASLGLQVSVNQAVTKGQLIAYVAYDNEDGGSWGPHLHFGIRKGKYSDSWVYYGYSPPGNINDWYDPSDFINSNLGNSNSPTCTFNIKVKDNVSQPLQTGWKFWRDGRMTSDFYNVELTINDLPSGSNWMLYLVDPAGNPRWQIDGNKSTSSYKFVFSPPNDAPNAEGYSFKLYPQGDINTIWSTSNTFCCSTLPTLNIWVSHIPLIINQQAKVEWNISGGIPTLTDGGWIGKIRLQWYQNGENTENALDNLASPTALNHEFSFQVPENISNVIIPGNNFKIAGVADEGTSLPPGLVYAFTDYFNIISATTNLNEQRNDMPKEFRQFQNYPNPFNPVTTIKYQLPFQTHVSLKIYDMLGVEISTLINEVKNPGLYEVEFDGGNLSSGIYFYQIEAGTYINTKKFVLMK